jgi:hypothetical protein
MATYYWTGAVNGGTGTWDSSSTTNWSASSGGAGGAGVPTAADVAILDASSGAGTVTIGSGAVCLTANMGVYAGTLAFGTNKISVAGNAATVFTGGIGYTVTGTPLIELTYAGSTGTRAIQSGGTMTEAKSLSFKVVAGTDIIQLANTSGRGVRDLDFTGFSGSWTFSSTSAFSIFGNLTLSAGMTPPSAAVSVQFTGTTGPYSVTTAGKTIDFRVVFNGIGGTWLLQDNFTIATGRTFTLTNGTLNANGNNLTLDTFALGTGTKTLTLGSGVWTIYGASWNANTNATGLTVSASTGTISMTSSSSKTFAGGGFSWPTLNQGGTGALTIQQGNSFANITNTVQPATITLTSATTQTVSAFGLSGAAGSLITLNSSSAGSQATLSDSSGINSVSFVSVKDINATGGAAWEAFITNGNVDAGNNTGWDFLVQTGRYMYNVRKTKRILQQGVV